MKLTLYLIFFLLTFLSVSVPTTSSRTGPFYSRNTPSCTPQYWSSMAEEWPRMVPKRSTVSKVFGPIAAERFRSDITLMETTARNEDGDVYGDLIKEATAALLNSYARKGYSYSAWEVKTLVIEALVSKHAAYTQTKHFLLANQACF